MPDKVVQNPAVNGRGWLLQTLLKIGTTVNDAIVWKMALGFHI